MTPTLDLKALRERLSILGRDGFDYATIHALLDELVALRADQERLLGALRKVRMHTAHLPHPSLELTTGLLSSIERIADAALAPYRGRSQE